MNVLKHPTVLRLAEKYGRTPAQVVLRWHLDQGISAIPKSVHAERIRENFHVFGFGLTKDEIEAIAALDTGVRAGPNPETLDTKSFSFKVDNSVAADTNL